MPGSQCIKRCQVTLACGCLGRRPDVIRLLQLPVALKLWPQGWATSWGAAAAPCPAASHPECKDFTLAVIHHEISFVMLSDELITLMKPSSPLCQFSWETTHRSSELYEIGKKKLINNRGQLHKSIRGTYSCHSKAYTSDSHTARHRTQQRTGLGHDGHKQFIEMTWQRYIGSHHVRGNISGRLARQVKYNF